MFTVAKREGKLVFVDKGGYQSRNSSTMWCIEEADKMFDFDDFEALEIWTGDCEPSADALCYSHVATAANTVPDFNFCRWAEAGIDDYVRTCAAIEAAGAVTPSDARVGWIGALSHPSRRTLYDMNDADFVDARLMSWGPATRDGERQSASEFLSLPDLVRTYALLADVEGSGYSGRLKYLLFSGRPVLLAERPHEEFFYEHLRPWTHYVPVKRDLSDLKDRVAWTRANAPEARAIADRAKAFAKTHLTRDAAYARWRDVIAERSTSRVERSASRHVSLELRTDEVCDVFYDAPDGSGRVKLGAATEEDALRIHAMPGHAFRLRWRAKDIDGAPIVVAPTPRAQHLDLQCPT